MVTLPLIHLDRLVFTPLPQLLLRKALIDTGVCEADQVAVLEHSRDDSLQSTLSAILDTKPGVVGFSCYTWNFLAVERLTSAIKGYDPQIKVVWGGPHVSELPRQFFDRYAPDVIVGWYGENVFPKVVRALGEGASSDEIAERFGGAWSKRKGRRGDDYPTLSDIGYPYDWLPNSVTDDIAERVFLIETYRGCPFSCSFCLWGQADKKIVALSEDEMVDHLFRVVDRGGRVFKFADAGLGLARNPDRSSRDVGAFRRFAEARLDRLGVMLRAYFFWQAITEDMCDVLAELIGQGVVGQLDIGIQTFNPAVLPDLQRATNFDKFFAVIEMLHRRNIRFSLDLILGLPGDNLEGFKKSLRAVISCRPTRFQSFPLSILPGTAYDLERERHGFATVRASYRDDDETVIANGTFPREQMEQAFDLEAWTFLWYGEGLFRETIHQHAASSGEDELAVLERLKAWGTSEGTHIAAAADIYRQKLHESRAEGRRLMDEYLMEHFADICRELFAWLKSEYAGTNATSALKAELLAFPKPPAVAATLDWARLDGDTLACDGTTYIYRRDPVMGAIATNRNLYAWQLEREQ